MLLRRRASGTATTMVVFSIGVAIQWPTVRCGIVETMEDWESREWWKYMGVCFSWIVGIIIVALIGYRTERQLLINQTNAQHMFEKEWKTYTTLKGGYEEQPVDYPLDIWRPKEVQRRFNNANML
mmetsp:Transcript_97908/g.280041  ORF Transcript_97908/g.280041 Transcript_97908/m.280041 type:complete len:125 (+) Transcript_97908:298-672(+)